MSKIIIENKSIQSDEMAVQAVLSVVKLGFISGEKQYCWVTRSGKKGVDVFARKTRGDTHSFIVVDIADIKK